MSIKNIFATGWVIILNIILKIRNPNLKKLNRGENHDISIRKSLPNNRSVETLLKDDSLQRSLLKLWWRGDWEHLISKSEDDIKDCRDRGTLAVLLSTAHQQCGDKVKAHQYIALAKRWGCSNEFMVKLLVASVHNNIGKAARLAKHTECEKRNKYEALTFSSVSNELYDVFKESSPE